MKKFNSVFFSPSFSERAIAGCVGVLLIFLSCSCSTPLYIPTENQETANVSLKDLKAGRSAYINKCGGCHTLIVPGKYSAMEWDKWVIRMEPKAKITPLEKEQILKYLTSGIK